MGPDSSWVLKAIEREAMSRAEQAVRSMPQTFNWMGAPMTQEQIVWLATEYECRTGQPACLIDPRAPHSERAKA